jgi:hypothetical protein
MLMPYVTIKVAAEATGLTPKAIRRKIEEGVWLEGREYRRGPDGHIYVSIEGFAKWVEGAAGSASGTSRSRSGSRSTADSSVTP